MEPQTTGTPGLRPYLAVALAAVIAVSLHWALLPFTGTRIPFLLFISGTACASVLLGRGPAMILLAVGAINALLMFPPTGSLRVDDSGDLLAIGIYLLMGATFVWGGEKIRQDRLRTAQDSLDAAQARHQVDIERRQSAEHLVRVLENSPIPFSMLAPVRREDRKIIDFAWQFANPAALAAYRLSAQQVMGESISDRLPHTWDEPGLLDNYIAVIEHGETRRFQLHSSSNGIDGWFDVIAAPLGGAVSVWFMDVTERMQREQALRRAEQRKDEFIATLAHELRNPLGPIRQAALLLDCDTTSAQQRQWCVSIIDRQVGVMATLLDDLLDLSRISAGKLNLRREAVELSAVIDSALETARPVIEKQQHEFNVEMKHNTWLDVDRIRLAQVVANLLTNAAKYTPARGHIKLRAVVDAAGVHISVTDDGIGIESGRLDEVFEIFTQVHPGSDRSQGGLGIGLALVKGLVDLHGGRIEAISDGADAGCTFTVHLPAQAVLDRPMSADSPRNFVASTGGRKILVADDNRDAADTLTFLLTSAGHTAMAVYDGEAAIAQWQAFQPEIAILDVGMPGKNGHEVATAIRSLPGGMETKLIALTGWGQPADRKKSADAGFDQHFTKPLDFEKLTKAVLTN
jgi:signal transduction histidine kinase